MLQYSLEVALCWSFLYLIYICFLRKETFFGINRRYLVGSLVAGLLIPLLRQIPINWKTQAEVLTEPLHFISAGPEYLAYQMTPVVESSSFDYLQLLYWVYGFGVLFMALRLCQGLSKIYKIYRQSEQKVFDDYTLVMSDQIHLPFSFLHYVFISEKLELNAEFKNVLTHELTHVKSRHTYDVLFIEILNVVFWWNPLIYLFKKELRQIHEYLADAMVIHDTDKKIYGQILLGQSQSGLQIALTHQFFNSHLKKRIQMMYTKKSKRSAMFKYLMALPVLLALMAAFAFTYEKAALKENLMKKFSDEFLFNDWAPQNLKWLGHLQSDYNLGKISVKDLSDKSIKVTYQDEEGMDASFILPFDQLNEIPSGEGNSSLRTNSYKNGINDILISYKNGVADYKYIKHIPEITTKTVKDEKTGKIKEQRFRTVTIDTITGAEAKNLIADYKNAFAKTSNEYGLIVENQKGTDRKIIKRTYGKIEDDPIRYQDAQIESRIKQEYNLHNPSSNQKWLKGLKDDFELETILIDVCDTGSLNVSYTMKSGSQRLNVIPKSELINHDKDPDRWIVIAKAEFHKLIKVENHHATYTDPKSGKQLEIPMSTYYQMEGELCDYVIYNPVKGFVRYITSKDHPEVNAKKIFESKEYYVMEKSGLDSLSFFDEETFEEDFFVLPFVFRDTIYLVDDKIVQSKINSATIKGDDRSRVIQRNGQKKHIKLLNGKAIYTYPETGEQLEIPSTIYQSMIDEEYDFLTYDPANEDVRFVTYVDKKTKKGNSEMDINETEVVDTISIFDADTFVEEVRIVKHAIKDTTYKKVDQMPRFPGCEQRAIPAEELTECSNRELLQFIYENLKYPTKAREQKIEGTTITQFVVEKDGTISNVKILREIGGGCGEASKRVIESMNEKGKIWTPGVQAGEVVRVLYTLPIKYKLREGDKEEINEETGDIENEQSATEKLNSGGWTAYPPLSEKANNRVKNMLYVYNGRVMDNDNLLNEISPEDIESINIYKKEKAKKAYQNHMSDKDLVCEIVTKSDRTKTFKEKVILHQNRPNPFVDETIIEFDLPSNGKATLTLFDFQGKELWQKNHDFPKGRNQVKITKTQINNYSGVIYYELEFEGQRITKKMISIESKGSGNIDHDWFKIEKTKKGKSRININGAKVKEAKWLVNGETKTESYAHIEGLNLKDHITNISVDESDDPNYEAIINVETADIKTALNIWLNRGYVLNGKLVSESEIDPSKVTSIYHFWKGYLPVDMPGTEYFSSVDFYFTDRGSDLEKQMPFKVTQVTSRKGSDKVKFVFESDSDEEFRVMIDDPNRKLTANDVFTSINESGEYEVELNPARKGKGNYSFTIMQGSKSITKSFIKA